ncbi:MAG: hypothetical protein NZ700_00970 [Gemmataceae bacterium]|nr:hypothetical protein [Gemmataceae bacterium]MDW8265788.1 hypothetical protein [Gemmataceae bacterium]
MANEAAEDTLGFALKWSPPSLTAESAVTTAPRKTTMLPPQGLPADPTGLARIVIDPNQPKKTRDEAWNVLIPTIEKIAESTIRCKFPGAKEGHSHWAAVQDAVSLIWQKLDPVASGGQPKYDPAKGRFQSWAKRVIHNHLITLCRQTKPSKAAKTDDELEEHVPEPPNTREEDVDIWDKRWEELLKLLNRLGVDMKPTSQGTDYFAVLLLRLRLALAERIEEKQVKELQWHEYSFSDFLERLLPWSDADTERRFQSDWPTLREIWQDIKECFDQPPFSLDGRGLCQRLSALRGSPVAPDLWHQWVRRAKTQAQKHASNDWAILEVFLPDRE